MDHDENVRRGVALADRGRSVQWEWAQLAYDEVGPVGESHVKTGIFAKLDRLRADIVAAREGDDTGIPPATALRKYRYAAEAIPAPLRQEIGIAAGVMLGVVEPFERSLVLDTLRTEGRRPTQQAVEETIRQIREAGLSGGVMGEPLDDPGLPVEAWNALSPEQRDVVLATPGTGGFNQVNDNIGWAKWSWNPVTGCLHNCAYCYARDIATRFYPQGFAPTLKPRRLEAPLQTRMPTTANGDPEWRRVFTCSMADLFGKWVPQDWIDAVFRQIVAAPQWEFLCLTKFPQRLAELDWPDNVWAGTTVDKQHRVDLAQRHFAEVTAGVKWLSCEPLLEPLRFESLEMFDWVVIGACTASSGAPEFAPPFDWVVDLYQQARDAGCRVYLKHNLVGPTADGGRRPLPGMEPVREWPR
jgi:protein gp37